MGETCYSDNGWTSFYCSNGCCEVYGYDECCAESNSFDSTESNSSDSYSVVLIVSCVFGAIALIAVFVIFICILTKVKVKQGRVVGPGGMAAHLNRGALNVSVVNAGSAFGHPPPQPQQYGAWPQQQQMGVMPPSYSSLGQPPPGYGGAPASFTYSNPAGPSGGASAPPDPFAAYANGTKTS